MAWGDMEVGDKVGEEGEEPYKVLDISFRVSSSHSIVIPFHSVARCSMIDD